MLNALQLFGEAKGTYGSTKSYSKCLEYLNAFDWEGHRTSVREQYVLSLWDKVSPINGITPEQILTDVPSGGEVILIYTNGKLTIMQKHDPSQSGFVAMNTELALEVGNSIIDNLIEQKVDEIAKETIIVQMII